MLFSFARVARVAITRVARADVTHPDAWTAPSALPGSVARVECLQVFIYMKTFFVKGVDIS